ncbi:MAG: hypothetical protein EBX99_13775, partial [Acidimicrobiia bacterium]|nr:hypothetical protein [Acidimicrobiia bacterium]
CNLAVQGATATILFRSVIYDLDLNVVSCDGDLNVIRRGGPLFFFQLVWKFICVVHLLLL